jgi:hypothetical protein
MMEQLRAENAALRSELEATKYELALRQLDARRLRRIMVEKFMRNFAIPKLGRVRKAIEKVSRRAARGRGGGQAWWQ